MAAVNPLKVAVVPVPVWVAPPGDTVIVQVPDEGNPLNATLPVATAQVGWVIAPTIGAVGAPDAAPIIALPDAGEVHPDAFVTVKVYVVPAVSPLTVAVVPVPVCDIPAGDDVNVHVPADGKPLNVTLPVAVAHVG